MANALGKFCVIAATGCLGVSALPVGAAVGTPAQPLRPLSECLDPQQARGWSRLDDGTVVVDAGRRKFLIRLPMRCPDLDHTPILNFRPAAGNSRLCGNATEALLGDARGGVQIPCDIASIESLTPDDYRARMDERERAKTGENGTTPIR